MAARPYLQLACGACAALCSASLCACARSDRGDIRRDSGIALRAEDEVDLVGNDMSDRYRAIIKISPRNRRRVLQAIYDASAGECRNTVPRTGGCSFMHQGNPVTVTVRPSMVVLDIL